MMKVTDDHWLDEAIRKPIPGGNLMPIRRFLIIHATAGATAQSSIDFWNTPAAKGASAHIVIDRDGTVYQCRPFNRTCGHAGVSEWTHNGRKFTGLNSCTIGMELANAQDSASADGTAFTRFPLPAGVVKVGSKWWEVYPQVQIDAAERVTIAVRERYNLDLALRHSDVSPDRKVDPGPAFAWVNFLEATGFE